MPEGNAIGHTRTEEDREAGARVAEGLSGVIGTETEGSSFVKVVEIELDIPGIGADDLACYPDRGSADAVKSEIDVELQRRGRRGFVVKLPAKNKAGGRPDRRRRRRRGRVATAGIGGGLANFWSAKKETSERIAV